MCFKVYSNGGATCIFGEIIAKYNLNIAYIVGKLIAKDNLNMENLMQTFENLLLQNCSTKFLDIAQK